MTVKATVRTKDRRRTVTALLGQTAPSVVDGRGGWAEVDRPRRPGAVEWVGTKPLKATLTLMLDGWARNKSVQSQIKAIEAMCPANPTKEQTAVYVTGAWPIPPATPWQIQTVTWDVDGMLRNPKGQIVRVEVSLELIELRVAEVVISRTSPAKRSGSKTGKSGREKQRTVTVRRGDTLSSIAAKYLDSASRWKEIADENNLRSPNNLRVGQKLRLP